MTAPAPNTTTAAYHSALLALQRQQRARLTTLIQQTEAALHADWRQGPALAARLYQPIIDEYAKALRDLRIANDDPAAKLTLDWLTQQQQQLRTIENSVRASMLNYSGQAARTVEDAQLKALGRGAQDAEALTQEALSPAFAKGVDPALLFNRPNPAAISQWVGRAGNGHPLGDLFSGFGAEATAAARQEMLLGLATGANPLQMVRGIQQALGISRSRAITIARTEILGSYRSAAHEVYRANSDVLQGWVWSAGGANPCACCAGMDGTLHGIDESLDDHPCFPAGMLVSGPPVLGSTTRWYEGNLIDIVTADGRLLSVTPNHPILTPRGWVAAGLLKEGDDVVCHSRGERGHTAPVGTPHNYYVPSPIEEIAVTLRGAQSVSSVTVPLTAKDFHGDGRGSVNCEIKVIGTGGILRDTRMWAYPWGEPLTEEQFSGRHSELLILPRSGTPNPLAKALLDTAAARLGRQHRVTILINGAPRHLDPRGITSATQYDTSSAKARVNSAPRDAEDMSEQLGRLPGEIAAGNLSIGQSLLRALNNATTLADEAIARLTAAKEAPSLEGIREALLADMEPCSNDLSALPGDIGLDSVLKISIRRFSGHVYNLQTTTGWYITNDIITHNCGKCAPIPATKSWDDILGPLGIDASDIPETSIAAPGAYTSISQKFDSYSPERQRAIIGTKTGYEAYKRGEVTLRDFVGVRPGSDGFPSQYYQKSLKEMQIPTRQAGRLVELNPDLMAKYRAGKLRASDLGAVTPDALMPAWAKQSLASRNVYQILRNGLPYNMTSHEQGLLVVNLEQMLKGELPVNVRAAVERQLQALGQTVERQTVGAAAAADKVAIEEAEATAKAALGREPTHIAESDVAAWTARNADGVPSVGYHYSTEAGVRNMLENGIDFTRARVANFGQGFYMFEAPDPALTFGAHEVRFAIHMEHPLVTDMAGWEKRRDEILATWSKNEEFQHTSSLSREGRQLSREFQELMRQSILKDGYDGLIMRDIQGFSANALDSEIIAIKPGTIRIIVSDEQAAALGQTVERQTVGTAAQVVETEAMRTAEAALGRQAAAQAREVLDESVAARIGISDIQPTSEFTRIVRDNQRGDLEWFADMHGMTVAEYEAAVSAKIAEKVDAGVISIREPEDMLEKILRDGRIKTVHESDSSLTINRGLKTKAELRAEVKMYQEIRAKYEQEAFGYPLDLPAELRPVSGYIAPLEGDDPMARGWGAARVVLKDDARARSTFTVGDSLQNMNSIPEPVNAPKYDAYPFQDGPAKGIERDWWASINDPLTESRFSTLPMTYYEAQIHGGVTTDDIAEIIFDAGHTPSPELESALSRLGIPWRMATGAP